MPADGMLLTVAEAADSSLLGALGLGPRAALAWCSRHRLRFVWRASAFASKGWTELPCTCSYLHPIAVVHGQSADPADAASREHQLNYLTLIPGPLHAGAAQLQVSGNGTHPASPG